MTIATAEQQTKDALVAAAPLVALVGDGIYPDEAPQAKAVPFVVFERGDTAPSYCMNDDLAASLITMTITAWAKTRSAANEIGIAITNAMHTAGHVQTSNSSAYEPEADEYAAVLGFDVWEI
jgi:hypothetical protein